MICAGCPVKTNSILTTNLQTKALTDHQDLSCFVTNFKVFHETNDEDTSSFYNFTQLLHEFVLLTPYRSTQGRLTISRKGLFISRAFIGPSSKYYYDTDRAISVLVCKVLLTRWIWLHCLGTYSSVPFLSTPLTAQQKSAAENQLFDFYTSTPTAMHWLLYITCWFDCSIAVLYLYSNDLLPNPKASSLSRWLYR